MKAFLEWLAKGAEESPGTPSSIRQVMTVGSMICFLIMLIVTLTWVTACIHAKALVEIPPSITGFITATLALLLTGKVVQTFAENKTPPPSE